MPSFAALLHRPADVSDEALSRGFAVALAGWDVAKPHLVVAPIPGLSGWSVAFYASDLALPEEAFEHAVELFEDELSPAVAVVDAAREEREQREQRVGEAGAELVVLTLVYGEDVLHDEAWRVTPTGFERWFVREGDHGVERGHETHEDADVALVGSSEEEDDAEADAALQRALRPHRGSTALSAALGVPVVSALMGALFTAERRLEVHLVPPGPASVAAETARLVRALGRVAGRGARAAGDPPSVVAGAPRPATHAAFAAAYDWADPNDPADLYRELAIGRIVGTLRFLRPSEIASPLGGAGLYPLARLSSSALGGRREGDVGALIAIAADGEQLRVVRASAGASVHEEAGPTFGELLRYLALGWSRRSDAEEDLIGALMLRARLRASAEASSDVERAR